MIEHVKLGVDVLAGGITVGAIIGWLPPIAAVMSMIWIGIQIYDRLTQGRK